MSPPRPAAVLPAAVSARALVSPSIAGITPHEPGKPIEEVERELGDALPPDGANVSRRAPVPA